MIDTKIRKIILPLISLVFCVCLAAGIMLLASVPAYQAVAETEQAAEIFPTEVKANSTFNADGLYTANYEINITFSAAFTTAGDGNCAPVNYRELSAALKIGEKSLTEWWTTFGENQNNFTLQKWGNRLRIIFNENLMHNTLKSTALDGMFVIQLTEKITNDLGTFKAFKYEMTPTDNTGGGGIFSCGKIRLYGRRTCKREQGHSKFNFFGFKTVSFGCRS